MSTREYVADSARYERCSQPHENAATLNEALQAFCDGVSALREEHRVTNVVLIIESSYRDADGIPVTGQSHFQLGDMLHHELMVARTLGKLQGERQRLVSDALNEAMREAKGSK
jgi:hypothetical protein